MSDYDDETLRVSGEVNPVSTPSAAIDHGRFVPGALVGSRYRIVAMLGKGGMGEVYRADDLLLGQPVALKFLPQRVAGDPQRLARLLAEVRIARQISHPNVCRVYDVGEVGNEHFISMEYVQGEDLRSLLQRIGRFGADKGLQIARQICAGLAAAHDRGVLHRDLKPANVMIDERGAARITDFGLAVLADSAEAQKREGTPAYMSPEQLDGEEVTTRSDIYSLGLVLYEIFSGQMLFDAKTLTELFELRRNTTPASIRLTKDIDPLVERVIQRCLAADPTSRPKSATSVSASLPGGDPLAAALAAGETPSPELVAGAGEHAGLAPARAVAALAVFLVLLAATLFCKYKVDMLVRSGVHEPPEAMAVRARDFLASIGYKEAPRDRVWRYRATRPQVLYWYRESPEVIVPSAFFRHNGYVNFPGMVSPDEPPLQSGGEALLEMDPQGHLRSLSVMPPDSNAKATMPADWNALLRAAAIDPASLTPAEPQRMLVASDHRAAWIWPERKLRIEAASVEGRPVYFDIAPLGPPPRRAGGGNFILVAFAVMVLLLVVFVVWRNIRLGRGDMRGAARVGLLAATSMLVAWLFGADHVASFGEVGMVIKALSWGTFNGVMIWAAYIALEPLFRRRWPLSVVTWTRLISGNWRDPLVGRDVLAGSIGGVVANTATSITPLLFAVMRGTVASPVWLLDVAILNGTRQVFAEITSIPTRAMADAFFPLALLILLRVVFRRPWLAGLAFLGVECAMRLPANPDKMHGFIAIALNVLVVLVLLHYFGFLSLVVSRGIDAMADMAPVLWPPASWHTGILISVLAVIITIAVYGFLTSLGGRRLFSADLLDA
jgi:Protein kinase domain